MQVSKFDLSGIDSPLMVEGHRMRLSSVSKFAVETTGRETQ